MYVTQRDEETISITIICVMPAMLTCNSGSLATLIHHPHTKLVKVRVCESGQFILSEEYTSNIIKTNIYCTDIIQVVAELQWPVRYRLMLLVN